jgi:hypothetical protein
MAEDKCKIIGCTKTNITIPIKFSNVMTAKAVIAVPAVSAVTRIINNKRFITRQAVAGSPGSDAQYKDFTVDTIESLVTTDIPLVNVYNVSTFDIITSKTQTVAAITVTIDPASITFTDAALASTSLIYVIYGGVLSTTIVGTAVTTGLAHYDGTTLKKYYQRNMPIGSVNIPSGVSVIGINAFDGSTKVNGVTIPSTVTTIGAQAFKSSGLTSVAIPSTVTTIDASAFEGCTALAYILAGDLAKVASITSAGTNTYICSGTTDITLNKYIGSALTVTIPSKIPSTTSADNVTIIGVECFKNLPITSVIIPASVTSIGASAFEGCNSLTTITIPASVTSIGAKALESTSLTSVIYGGSESINAMVGGTGSGLAHYVVTSSPSSITLKKYYPRGMTAGTVTIPNEVTSIGASAFEGATVLTGVTIGTGVTSIGASAFKSTGLTSVTIPASVTSIGASAFKSTGLTSVTIPASVTSIGASAFEGCTELLSVDILGTTASTTLVADTFKDCTKLAGIKVGAAEVTITDAVFGNTGTTRVYLYTGTTLLKYFPRGSSDDLHFVTNGAKHVGTTTAVTFATIAAGAFSGVTQLQKLTIRGDTTIESGAFTGCSNLYGIVVTGGNLKKNSVSSSLTSTGYIFVDGGTIDNGADDTNPVFPSTANTVNRVVNTGFNSDYTKLFGSGYGNSRSTSSKPVYVNNNGIANAADTFDKKYIDNTRYTNLKNFFTSSAVTIDISYLDSVIETDTLSDSNAGLTTTNQGLTSTNQGLTTTNQQLTTTNQQLTTTNQGLTTTNQGLTTTNQGLTTTNQGLTTTNQGLTTTNQQLTTTNQGLTTTIAGNREDLIKSISQKVKSINFAIDEIKNEQNRNNRHSYFFSQDNYINLYRNRIALILYYIVFILLALSLYLNRESYSIVMIVILLIIFALLPFVIKYLTRFAYNQFLNLLKLFYDGNVRYTNTKIE